MRRMPLLLAAAALCGACKDAPPVAPTALNELAGFMFERFDDDDPEELQAGLVNLEKWLRLNMDDVQEGYTVDDLSLPVIQSVIPGPHPELDKLGGASVAWITPHDIDPMAEALTIAEQEEVFPDSYDVHERTFVEGRDCFPDKNCDFLITDNYVESSYALGLSITTNSRAEYRWVDYQLEEDGPVRTAFLHRVWLTEPAAVSGDLVVVHDQLALNIAIPWGQSSLRLGTVWVAADILGGVVGEDTALNEMIKNFKKESENLDTYLDGQ